MWKVEKEETDSYFGARNLLFIRWKCFMFFTVIPENIIHYFAVFENFDLPLVPFA